MDLDLPRNNTEILARFRTSNHRLPIETGRWTNIPRNQRTCNLCGDGLGDEYHYIMICKSLKESRKLYVPSTYTFRPNTLKFYNLFTSEKISVINNLCRFIKVINKRVTSPG